MRSRWRVLLAVCLLGSSSPLASVAAPRKPRADLKVLPASGPPSTNFLFVVTLTGGEETEDLHCLTLEWKWGEADSSVHEPECEAFEPGRTAVQRRFTMSRRFSTEGARNVEVVLRKGEKQVASASVGMRVTWEKKPPEFRAIPGS